MDRAVVDAAIQEARSCGGNLIVLSVLDPAIPGKVVGQFMESGQIGTRPSEAFLESLYKRHEQLALQQAEEIVTDAKTAGVAARSEIRRGDYAKRTAEVIVAAEPDVVVLERRKRSLLRFSAEDSFIDDLKRKVGFKLVEVE